MKREQYTLPPAADSKDCPAWCRQAGQRVLNLLHNTKSEAGAKLPFTLNPDVATVFAHAIWFEFRANIWDKDHAK